MNNDLAEIPAEIGQYKTLKEISSGSYGLVIQVQHKTTKVEYACKIVSRQQLSDKNVFQCFEQELRIHERLTHQNVVKLVEIIYEENYIFVILELCEKQSLYDYLSNSDYSYQRFLKKITYQLCNAVDYIHSKGVIHHDIKPENILLDVNMNTKLADFGCATEQNRSPTNFNGTLGYAAPELVDQDSPYSDGPKIDIWSIGITVYTLANGVVPWRNVEEFYQRIFEDDYSFLQELSPDISEFVAACLKVNPNERPTAAQLKDFEWIKNVKKLPAAKKAVNRSYGVSSSYKDEGGKKKNLLVRGIGDKSVVLNMIPKTNRCKSSIRLIRASVL
ncbi:CAMK family protein kinase [Tritrichomonas foetus]|uniref:CAMK family protein kinase n=1 Tax=Tritrichomonas foetus TaxID=1144522 RepID=A0A1J4K501_9EUKA|nr:CAMK family protein kinase [Tritrichomonas foetus]|eukprot:OHT06058.1 CAMK family protein kinase [Tritrichomonas foetus]